jgi:phenol 2-monooxygenase
MNVSMHDSLNLAWKLALTTRGLASPALLSTYESERRQIAQQLLDFDFEHANAFHDGDAEKLAENFANNIRFISGVGADYAGNVLNWAQVGSQKVIKGGLKVGALLPVAKATRFIDANPVDLQLDIPMLCQFRIYFVVADVANCMGFLKDVCEFIASEDSVLGRARRKAEESYAQVPKKWTEEEVQYGQLGRYETVSKLFTPAILFGGDKWHVEIENLPELIKASPWTVYHDDLGAGEKWTGGLSGDEIAIVSVRPDGYVGSVGRWTSSEGEEAKKWLDGYYGGILSGA